jgi:phosphoglycerate dehydrogenase-like enzyme
MIKINTLKNKHIGQPAFCMGTAPHLNKLNLDLIKDFVSIGCNQLLEEADRLNINYICFQREERFVQVKNRLSGSTGVKMVLPESIITKNEECLSDFEDRIIPIHLRFTTPGHAEMFSFDLENCVYAGDSIAIEIQLAVWMGCNPIYILGVDAQFHNHDHPFYDEMKMDEEYMKKVEKYSYNDLKEWLKKTKSILWSRGIRLFNAAGDISKLDVLPRIRLEAATGNPKVAVTSKTFSQDEYLVNELKRYFSEVKINNSKDKLKDNLLVDFLKDCDGMILGTEPFDAEVIRQLPCLRNVSKYGVGLNNIDFDAVKRHEIDLVYKKGVNSDSVAELVLCHSLNLIRKVEQSVQGYKNGKWKKLPGKELAEMTVGIIGYGHVGKVVAHKFASLKCARLLVNDLIDFPQQPPYEFVPLDYLLSESDIVTIHIDAESRNYNFVNKDFIDKMKNGAFLINTSRGTVVEVDALIEALNTEKLSGAALDVYKHEPDIDERLKNCSNLLTSCHIAGSSNRAIKNMGWAAIEGILKLFNIEPV